MRLVKQFPVLRWEQQRRRLYVSFPIFVLTRKISKFRIISIGSVQEYAAATMPQYGSGLYAPTLTGASTLNSTASLVAGKQIEGLK